MSSSTTEKAAEGTPHGAARLAGAVYAIVVASGMFSLAYAPGVVFGAENTPDFVRTITAHEPLLRAAIAAELLCYVAFLTLAIALYILLEGTGRFTAMMMAGLAASSVPFGFANVGHLFEILRSLDAGGSAAPTIADAYARYNAGLSVQSIPWGVWLIPFGVLVVRCGFLPRVLGALLILGGLGYVANFLGRLFVEDYAQSTLAQILRAPRIAEILICVWLLVFGARRTLFAGRAPSGTSVA